MFRAMLKKECVELLAPFLLAAASLTFLVSNYAAFGRWQFIPQGEWMLGHHFFNSFMLISLTLAIAMGLMQSLSEDIQGTWRYVLAMPGGWQRILKLKLACGAVVWLAWSLAVIVICQLGIAVHSGPAGEPFSKLIDPTLRVLVCAPVVYLGAFLTALRRSNWFFSRLMPLAGTLMCWFSLTYLPNWWVVAPLVCVGFSAVIVAIVFHVAAERDFA